jgi:hypothetical protein
VILQCAKCGPVALWPKRLAGLGQFQSENGRRFHAVYYGGDFGYWCGPLRDTPGTVSECVPEDE